MRVHFAFGFALLVSLVSSQPASTSQVAELYTKREVEIPMRDGVTLFTSIYIPKDQSKPAPFLMQRTPYSARPYGEAMRTSLGPEASFVQEGYIFVYQDVRGRYMSGGDFKWMTPYIPNKKPGQVDESTDTHDTIEWLLRNVPNNNGRVGVYGTSFPGHYAAQAIIDPHPALKAASPQAPMADNWMGDDMFHGGAFFLPHAMNFIRTFGKVRPGPIQNYGPPVFQHGTNDGYQFFLQLGPVKNSLDKYNMSQIPLWVEWINNPTYNEYWKARNVPQHLKKAGKVAVLTVGGWFDAEDLPGPLSIYQAIEKNTPRNNSTLVMGPWYHGSWNSGPGTSLHDLAWTTRTGEVYRNEIQKPFFRAHLWEEGEPELPEAMMFDLGADRFGKFETWPPKEAKPLNLYLAPGRQLLLGETHRAGKDSYVSDPANPVPNSATVTIGMARSYMLEDQRFVADRPDVLRYESAPLDQPMTLAGPLKATLYVTTTGTDADFVVKLIDVFPDDYSVMSPRSEEVKMGGYQMMVRGEPIRTRYRTGWNNPTPLQPGKVAKIEFTLPDVFHTFRKGHRLMVQVHSTWFPLMDRNPQTFVPNIFFADEKDFVKATHTLHLGGRQASRLEVRAMPRK